MSEAEGTVENTESTSEAKEGNTTMLGANPDENKANSETGEDGKQPSEEEGKNASEVKDGKTDKTEEDGAPEKYEDFSYPDGMEVDTKAITEFSELAKELNLSQEMAQKLVDFDTTRNKTVSEANSEYYDNLMSEWQETVRNDKEIGGAAFDESLGAARSALDAFATPELMEILETSGMGNHPEIVRVFARIGKAVKEDKIRIGGANPSAPKDPADILFPNQNK